MQFKPAAWSDEVHRDLITSHEVISTKSGISRGKNLEPWSHGQMVPIGSRLPTGGIKGDCFREYPVMAGTTEADIRELMQYAAVSFSDFYSSSGMLKFY